MAGVQIKSLDQPEETIDYDADGDARAVTVGRW